jgi:hypothetical protein
LDLAATLLLLGAQVISEYERVGRADQEGSPQQLPTNQALEKPTLLLSSCSNVTGILEALK